jgi:hypothetical protein
MDPMAESLDSLLDQVVEVEEVLVGEENLLPAVAPEHHVVDATGNVETRFPGHVGRLAR